MSRRAAQGPGTIDVTVTMSRKFLKRLDDHLERIGEPKRSPWIRAACRRRLNQEESEMRQEEEDLEG